MSIVKTFNSKNDAVRFINNNFNLTALKPQKHIDNINNHSITKVSDTILIVDEFNLLGETTKEPIGTFVDDGNSYQINDYVFRVCNNDEGFSFLEVEDYDGNYIDDIYGIGFPNEDDIESILKFETIITDWLIGRDLI